MTPRELVGRVAAAYLRRELSGGDEESVARYVVDGLGVEQTAAVARAVLGDPWLSGRVAIRFPVAVFAAEGLPEEVLTVQAATVFRDADCDRAAYLVTSVGEDGEGQSLQDLSRLGGAELLERMSGWVEAIDDGLGLDDDSRTVLDKALSGLAQLRTTSLDRFAGYVLRVRDAVAVEGHPLVDAMGAALPALRLPSDSKAFAAVKERSRRHVSAWQREFANLYRRRRGYLLKETPSQLVLNQEELRAAFVRSREAIPEEHHPVIERFIAAHPGWNAAAAELAERDWEQVKPLFEGLARAVQHRHGDAALLRRGRGRTALGRGGGVPSPAGRPQPVGAAGGGQRVLRGAPRGARGGSQAALRLGQAHLRQGARDDGLPGGRRGGNGVVRAPARHLAQAAHPLRQGD